LRAAGCDAIVYNPLWRGVFGRQRRRNHRKLLVVDDRAAFIGGFNLVDAFVGDQAWLDVAVEVHGPPCAVLGRRLRHEPHGDHEQALGVLLSDVGGGRRLRRRYLRAIGLVGSFNLDPYSLAGLEVLVDACDRRLAVSASAWIERHVAAARPIMDARPSGGRLARLLERLKGELGLWLARAIGRLMARR
jgi:hypothetical protein